MGVPWIGNRTNASNRAANDFSGGINNGTPSLYISDSQSSDEYGFDTFDHPAASVGKGWTAYGASGAAETNMLANYQNKYVVRAVGTKMQYDNSGTWTDITGATGLTDTFWDYTNFNEKLLATNGTDNVKYWNGTTFGDLNASAPKGKYISNNTIRVFIANVSGKEDWVYFSKYLDETNWTDTTSYGFFQYYTDQGGPITALYSYQSMVMVFKKDSFAEIITTGNSENKYRLAPISSQVGTVSNRTIQEIRGILFFLGVSDVWMFTGGQPTPIGANVKGTIDSINPAYYSKCWAATDGQRYYLGVVTGSNTEVDTLLVYDVKYQVWRIRSKSLPSLRCAVTIGGNVWYTGDNSGQTFKMNSGTTENGSAINWSITSKTFVEGMLEAEKEYFEMHTQTYLPSGSTASLSISTDDRSISFTTIDSLATGTSAGSSNDIIPLDTVPITNYMRYNLSGSGQATLYQNQRQFRYQPIQT